ncbi:MAG: hypothetical protein JNK78_20705 [Planctomycetes bacterium]|nr:hypothetical protein [Planctomycetota bacterium]
MLARSPAPTHRPRAGKRAVASVILIALAACSTVPAAWYPEFVDHDLAAEFVVADDGRLPLPSTTRALVVRSLELDPPPFAEHFESAGRWFAYRPGTAVRVHCQLRAYAQNDGRVPTVAEILPGARSIRVLDNP